MPFKGKFEEPCTECGYRYLQHSDNGRLCPKEAYKVNRRKEKEQLKVTIYRVRPSYNHSEFYLDLDELRKDYLDLVVYKFQFKLTRRGRMKLHPTEFINILNNIDMLKEEKVLK